MQDVVVVGHKTDEKHGYNAVQIGFRTAKEKHVNKPQLDMYKGFVVIVVGLISLSFAHTVICKGLGIEPKREVREFRVTADAFPPIGAEITAQHFVPGKDALYDDFVISY